MRSPPRDADSPVFQFMRALLGCDKPVVAAVTGAAIGIGTTMLLHCDFVYVSDEARLAMPFVGLGLVPEFASSLVVPQLMGNNARGREAAAGRPFTGADAAECGIANAVLPAGGVLHARRVAERFNELPPGAVQQTKRLLRRARREAELQAIAAEARSSASACAALKRWGGLQRVLPEAQAGLLEVLVATAPSLWLRHCAPQGERPALGPGGRPVMSLALKLALAPLLVARRR